MRSEQIDPTTTTTTLVSWLVCVVCVCVLCGFVAEASQSSGRLFAHLARVFAGATFALPVPVSVSAVSAVSAAASAAAKRKSPKDIDRRLRVVFSLARLITRTVEQTAAQ